MSNGIPGGYCTNVCESDSQCSEGSVCVLGNCAIPCNEGTCPEGERCFDADSGVGACIATCTTDADCFPGRTCYPDTGGCWP